MYTYIPSLLDLQGGGERKVYFFSSFLKSIYLFNLLVLVDLYCCTWAFSSCREQGLLFVGMCGLLLLQSTGFGSCSSWALGSWAVLWSVGLVVLQYVGSSWTKDQTGVPCIARWILNHRTTRETSVSLMVENA